MLKIMAREMNPEWFGTSRIREGLHLTREVQFYEGNRANIWLINGPGKDVIIDTGLGVCDLREHLAGRGLIHSERECTVICTHNHFDHSGGAHHFQNVFIHEEDLQGLQQGRQTETLNYVKGAHFFQQPYRGFSACRYKVPPTPCQPLKDGDMIDIGGGEYLEILHLPGHTNGSIVIYYPSKRELFTGDFVYECGSGVSLLDWLPTSSVERYVRSAYRMIEWMQDKEIVRVYPGHFHSLPTQRVSQLLQEYVDEKDNECSKCSGSCLPILTRAYFILGCFRCCPC